FPGWLEDSSYGMALLDDNEFGAVNLLEFVRVEGGVDSIARIDAEEATGGHLTGKKDLLSLPQSESTHALMGIGSNLLEEGRFVGLESCQMLDGVKNLVGVIVLGQFVYLIHFDLRDEFRLAIHGFRSLVTTCTSARNNEQWEQKDEGSRG
ncbi:hypothetical protein PENTCL1PPCAC_668, partial [Pristionchus entomophagus]